MEELLRELNLKTKEELLEYMKQNPDDELVQQIIEQYELYINGYSIDNSIQEGEE